MKYLIPVFILLSLLGCKSNLGAFEGGTKDVYSGQARGNAEASYKGRVIKRGVFKLLRSGGIVASPGTSTGKSIAKPVLLLVQPTDRIPLIKDVYMSLQYRIWNLPDRPAYINLRRVVKHPPMKLPDGKVSTGSDYRFKGRVSIGQTIAYTGYGLNEDYEMVEGDWIFQIWHKDKMLIEQKFTTYRPDKKEAAEWEARLKVTAKAPTRHATAGKAASAPPGR